MSAALGFQDQGVGSDASGYAIAPVNNPPYRPNVLFKTFENLNTQRMKELVSRYHLEDIGKGEPDEFKRMVLLRHWIKGTLNKSGGEFPSHDVFAVLDSCIKTPSTTVSCGSTSRVGNAVMNACGYVSRILSCGYGVRNVDPQWKHGSTEVWSNTYCKWVVFDPEQDCHFEKGGIPLSAMDLRDENQKNGAADVVIAFGPDRRPVPSDKAERNPKFYTWVEWNAYGDFHSAFPAEQELHFWYKDAYSSSHTWHNNGSPHWLYAAPAMMQWIDRRDSIEWTPDTIEVTAVLNGSTAQVSLGNCMPNFKEYQIRDNSGGGPWASTTAKFSVPLTLKQHDWSIRAVNLAGVTGPEYHLVIQR